MGIIVQIADKWIFAWWLPHKEGAEARGGATLRRSTGARADPVVGGWKLIYVIR